MIRTRFAWPALLVVLCACNRNGSHPPGPSRVLGSFSVEQLWSSDNDWEPYVAADPAGPWVYEATTRIGTDIARIVVRVSGDGGQTWGDDTVLSDTYDAYDPQLAVAADTGCVVFAWLGGQGGWTTLVRTSCDHGQTWTDPVSITPLDWTTDHAWLTVSPDGQDVYLAFNGAEPGGHAEAGKGYVAVSHDGGASFTDTAVAGDGTDYWFETGAAIDPDGALYVANTRFSTDYTGPADLVLWRSTDGGASFDTSVVATSQEPPSCDWSSGCTFGFFGAQAAVATDPTGAVLFTWVANDTPGGDLAMYAVSSPGGADWKSMSQPVLLSAGLGLNDMPAVAAGPGDGEFTVVWQGNQSGNDPETFGTWLQYTADGGGSWLDAPLLLSNRFDGAPYKQSGGYAFPYGDYLGLSVGPSGATHVIWGEGASWDGPGGTWQAQSDTGS